MHHHPFMLKCGPIREIHINATSTMLDEYFNRFSVSMLKCIMKMCFMLPIAGIDISTMLDEDSSNVSVPVKACMMQSCIF